MNTLPRLVVALSILAAPSASWSQDILEGTYEGRGQEGGSLRVIVDGRDVGVTIKAAGCLGNVEGYLAKNTKGDLFMVSSTYKDDRCAVAIGKQGKFAFSMRQGPECSYHHGAACSFNGYVERTR